LQSNIFDAISTTNPAGRQWERKTLLLVARYADACNLIASDVDEIAHKLAVVRAHCGAEVETTTPFGRRPFI
jgi:hypothetical protein